MGQTLLVTVDVPLGADVLKALDAAGLKPSVFLWAQLSECQDRRLLVASRHLDGGGARDACGLIFDAMDAVGIGVRRAPDLFVCRMDALFIKTLRHIHRKTPDMESMRLGDLTIGNRTIEDSSVYRLV
jgi:hypothetical protein